MKFLIALIALAASIGFLGVGTASVAALAPSHPYFAAAIDDIKGGVDQVNPSGITVQGAITAIVNILSLAVGVFSVIMIIYGGFKFVSSAGDPNGIASAKKTIIYALVGLTLAVLAQAIMRAVIGKVSSAG